MKHELINVIVAGFPNKLATSVATTCKQRGFNVARFGASMKDFNKDSIEVPDLGKLRLYKFGDSKLKDQLKAEVDESKRESRFPIVADVSNLPENVELYNDCNVPFVMQSADHKTRIQSNEKAKQLAVISEDFNKYAVAFDAIMREWGRRFPGLFRGFDVVGDGLNASRHLSHSFNDLLDKEFHKNADKQKPPASYVEGMSHQEFAFKDGKGSTTFSFKRSAGPEDFAEGMADAIQFLAKQAELDLPARVYSMVDVARRAPLMML
jgi:hypothetical protein